jgi:hypothetical protein
LLQLCDVDKFFYQLILGSPSLGQEIDGEDW